MVQYKSSMDPTPTSVLPNKVTFKYTEGTSKYFKGTRKKSIVKPKVDDKKISKKIMCGKSRKGVSKKATKPIPEKSVASVFFDVDVQEKKNTKIKVVGVLKQIKKIRDLNQEELYTKAPTPLQMIETDRDSKATEDDLFRSNDCTFHISLRKDTNVELTFEEIRILDATMNVSNMDTKFCEKVKDNIEILIGPLAQ
ncbi:unnamed protein product [Lactuca saligna]|uniref:Uncharacterized protein n=1 Tax=Lactuca saligna TaxID=75948 RepID=A0AA35UV98_LACSI|nr:unnamed protein product [Lactuca saligna]